MKLVARSLIFRSLVKLDEGTQFEVGWFVSRDPKMYDLSEVAWDSASMGVGDWL